MATTTVSAYLLAWLDCYNVPICMRIKKYKFLMYNEGLMKELRDPILASVRELEKYLQTEYLYM